MIGALLAHSPPQFGAVPEDGAEIRLRAEIETLAKRLAIPGIAYGVVRDGELLFDGAAGYSGTSDQPFTVRTPLDIASISKSIAAVAVMQAMERGELALSDPIIQYLPDFSGPAEITVRHLLSHTSEGIPGEEYKYMPTRYALLGSILEEVTGQQYPSIVRERILESAGMEEHPSPNLTAGWGMISTAENLFKYAIALDRELSVERATQELMATPAESPRGVELPVGLGWFGQVIQGESVTWGYGQGEETSLLFLRVPRLRLTLVIAAESDRLSNPFRLLHGDVRSSPFAMAFVRNLVVSAPRGARQSPDWTMSRIAELEAELDEREVPGSYRFGDELVAHALLEAFHSEDASRAGDLLELALRRYPDSVPSLSWLELANVVERESLGPFAVKLADRLVRTRPTSPWVLTVAGDTYMRYGDPLEAVATWSRVASLPNQEPHVVNISLNAEAWNNIGEYWVDTDPGLARTFFLRAIETGGGWELQRSQHLLREAQTERRPKLLLIGVDGIRVDILLAAQTPNLDALTEVGELSLTARTRPNTVSGPGWSSMLTGVWMDKHGVPDNDFSSSRYDEYPDFLTRIETARPELSTLAVLDWPPLGSIQDGGPVVSPLVDLVINVNGDNLGYAVADQRSTGLAAARLREGDPDATFVYLGNPDVVAHDTSSLSAEYRASIEAADRQIGVLLAAVRQRPSYDQEDWLIISSTDHGRTDDGGHGGESEEELTIYYLVSGPSTTAVRNPTEVVDVACTALAHLGVEIDAAWNLDCKVNGVPDEARPSEEPSP